MKKLKYIAITISVILTILIIYAIIWEIADFKLDYKCSTMPYDEFIRDNKCKKYWSMRNT